MTDLVSVVITCYNHRRFLPDALGSVAKQSYAPVEAIVVDDGSTEDIRSVVEAWPQVKYVRQRNRGVSAARNHGLRRSRGAYVSFLDAEDRLRPHAIADGLRALECRPDAMAAVGLCRIVDEDGEPVPFQQKETIDEDPYRELLRANFIWMPAQVLYRRGVFASVGRWDTRVDACADYDLYLRIARRHRLAIHRRVVADYRRHGTNMSSHAPTMLSAALRVLERQRPYVQTDPIYCEAFALGRQFWRSYYGEGVVEAIRRARRTPGARKAFIRSVVVLMRHHPTEFAIHLRRNLARLTAVIRRRPIDVP